MLVAQNSLGPVCPVPLTVAEAEENNLDWNAKNPRWERWHTCSLCEQRHHDVVACALGWACYAQSLYENDGASREDVTAAIATLEDIDRRGTRVYGPAHPQAVSTRNRLADAREKLARAK